MRLKGWKKRFMGMLLAFTDLIIEYWYISAMLFLALIAILVAVVVLIARAVKQIKEDSQVNKARKKDSEEKKAVKSEVKKEEVKKVEKTVAQKKEEKKAVKAEPKKKEEKKEAVAPASEDTTEAVIETTEVVETDAEKREIKAVYRVIYDKENREWMVKKDGAQRVIRRVKTKAEALELASQFATNQDLSISVQKKDGKFQKKRNYKSMMPSDKGEK